jgi:hypothetical protein
MRSVMKKTLAQTRAIRRSSFAIVLGLAAVVVTASSASAVNVGAVGTLGYQIRQDSSFIDVDVVVVRRGAVVRPGVARPGGWVRPARYTWRPGGAIAAGAAIGFVAAATATAWAGAPPAPGYCWYYTDPGQTQGFWDVCPQ